MKYQVGDKFEDRKNNVSVEITSYNPFNGVYIVATQYKNNVLPHDTNYIEIGLDDLVNIHNWTYIPKQPNNPPIPTLGSRSGWVSYIPSDALTEPRTFGDRSKPANELKCSHSLYEEKVLFTSWYKVCKTCKKEFE